MYSILIEINTTIDKQKTYRLAVNEEGLVIKLPTKEEILEVLKVLVKDYPVDKLKVIEDIAYDIDIIVG